jgi:hypothetical protein
VPAGNLFPIGNTSITYTAKDAAGNMATATQTVTVIDNTPPTITCPANITVTAPLNSSSVQVVYPPATANDNCTVASIVYSLPSGSNFPVGTTTVTSTATDPAGNSGSCSFTVTVLTPQGAVGTIRNIVAALVNAGVLNKGEGDALTAKLDAAIQQLDRGNTNAAINQLQAFINQVEALARSGRLTQAQSQPLINVANMLINLLKA